MKKLLFTLSLLLTSATSLMGWGYCFRHPEKCADALTHCTAHPEECADQIGETADWCKDNIEDCAERVAKLD